VATAPSTKRVAVATSPKPHVVAARSVAASAAAPATAPVVAASATTKIRVIDDEESRRPRVIE